MEFITHTLENGLEIVAECNPAAHSTALAFFVQTGARDETDEVAGVSHFLEHMMFKGTPTRSFDDVNRGFDDVGAHPNAATGEENTIYHAAMLPEYQDHVLQLWADVLRPALREEDFETEKQVIIEEIRMYDDQPPFGAHEKCMARYFGSHPLGRSILGTVASITNLRVEAMREYFQRRYSPRNIVVVGAGKIDFERFVASVDRYCGSWTPTDTARAALPVASQPGFYCVHKPSATQEYIVQLSAAPADQDADRYAAKVLATILGDDSGSRLYWSLVDPGLAENAAVGHSDYQGAGLFMTYMGADPEFAQSNLQIIQELYRQVQSEGVTPAELDQAKSKIASRIVLSGEKPRGRLWAVGGNWTQRREYRSVQDDLAAIDAVTLDDLHAVLLKYPLTQSTTVAIGPLEKIERPL